MLFYTLQNKRQLFRIPDSEKTSTLILHIYIFCISLYFSIRVGLLYKNTNKCILWNSDSDYNVLIKKYFLRGPKTNYNKKNKKSLYTFTIFIQLCISLCTRPENYRLIIHGRGDA